MVDHVIVRHGLTPEQAEDLESALIDLLDLGLFSSVAMLTNKVAGRGAGEHGIKSIAEIIKHYGPEPLQAQPVHLPGLMLTINQAFRSDMTEDELYRVTRESWKVGERREAVRRVFAVYRGVVQQVYEVDRWFPTLDQDGKPRWAFDGRVATDCQQYIGKVAPTGAQNPVKYLMPDPTGYVVVDEDDSVSLN
jgi:uncharacterized protein